MFHTGKQRAQVSVQVNAQGKTSSQSSQGCTKVIADVNPFDIRVAILVNRWRARVER